MGAPKLTVVWGAAFPLEFQSRHFGAGRDPPDKRFARGDNTGVALSLVRPHDGTRGERFTAIIPFGRRRP